MRIVIDSGADLPQEIAQESQITLVPLTVTLDGQEFRDGLDITGEEFARRMKAAQELPKTAHPSPGAFLEVFSESPDFPVLCVTLSSQLSGTFQSATLAKEMVTQTRVVVIDSRTASLGVGLLALKARDLDQAGWPFEKIVEKVSEYRDRMKVVFALDTLENIVKGGRMPKWQGLVAELLNIKAILHGVQGRVEPLRKVRGQRRIQEALLGYLSEHSTDLSDSFIGISHVDNLSGAQRLKEEIAAKYRPKGIIINSMGATLATYAGQGALMINF